MHGMIFGIENKYEEGVAVWNMNIREGGGCVL